MNGLSNHPPNTFLKALPPFPTSFQWCLSRWFAFQTIENNGNNFDFAQSTVGAALYAILPCKGNIIRSSWIQPLITTTGWGSTFHQMYFGCVHSFFRKYPTSPQTDRQTNKQTNENTHLLGKITHKLINNHLLQKPVTASDLLPVQPGSRGGGQSKARKELTVGSL